MFGLHLRRPADVDIDRDLGFGAVVSRESKQRLLNRDGGFNVRRTGLRLFPSLNTYHWLLNLSWTRFFGLVVLVYLVLNLSFGIGYLLCGESALFDSSGTAPGIPFWRAFFFSVHTLATIGYGNVAPVGMAANLLVTVEALVGPLSFALVTGILFARFSRPSAKLVFSRHAIIAPYRGATAFEIRLTNARRNQIVELEAKLIFTRFEDSDGVSVRKYYLLELERRKVAFFPLAWTIVHPIDEQSPLAGLTHADLRAANSEFLVLLNGFDETFSQTVHTRTSYKTDEIIWGARFGSMYNTVSDADPISIDVRLIDSTEAVELPLAGKGAGDVVSG